MSSPTISNPYHRIPVRLNSLLLYLSLSCFTMFLKPFVEATQLIKGVVLQLFLSSIFFRSLSLYFLLCLSFSPSHVSSLLPLYHHHCAPPRYYYALLISLRIAMLVTALLSLSLTHLTQLCCVTIISYTISTSELSL